MRKCLTEIAFILDRSASMSGLERDNIGGYNSLMEKHMVERQREKYGWEFLFLGANIDAVAEAGRFGIKPSRAVNYECDEEGTAVNYKVLSKTVSMVRHCASAQAVEEALDGWDEDIKADYSRRHGR